MYVSFALLIFVVMGLISWVLSPSVPTSEDVPNSSGTPTAGSGNDPSHHAVSYANRQELISALEPSVCKLIVPDGNGTGFVVATNIIATNKHVVGCWDAALIEAEFGNQGPRITASVQPPVVVSDLKLAFAAEDYDLCLLRTTDIPPHIQPIPPAQSNELLRGQEIILIGCPYGEEGTISPGVLNQLRSDIGEHPLLSLSAAVNPGNSGGPVITMSGEAAGVVVLKHGTAEGLGYAVPASVISESLQRLSHSSDHQIENNVAAFLCKQASTSMLLAVADLVKSRADSSTDIRPAKLRLVNARRLIENPRNKATRQELRELLDLSLTTSEQLFVAVSENNQDEVSSGVLLFDSIREQLRKNIGFFNLKPADNKK